MPKTTVRGPPRANGWTLAHCPPSSEWGPDGNTGEIKAARKGTGHSTSKSRWLRTSVLYYRHSPTYGSYMGLTFTLPPSPIPTPCQHATLWIIRCVKMHQGNTLLHHYVDNFSSCLNGNLWSIKRRNLKMHKGKQMLNLHLFEGRCLLHHYKDCYCQQYCWVKVHNHYDKW